MDGNNRADLRAGEEEVKREESSGSQQQRPKLKDFDVIESDTEEEEDLSDLGTRIAIFTLFWTSSMFGNLDTGVIPTTLHLIMDELHTTNGETAFLASVSFLATGLGSLIVSPMMKVFPAKNVLICA